MRFRLDRMDGLVGVLTWVVLLFFVVISCGTAAIGLFVGDPTETVPVVSVGALVGVFVVAILAAVWLWYRPSWFELREDGLLIRWPMRKDFLPLDGITDVELLSKAESVAKYGRGARIGSGGVWGGFGYRTSKAGMMRMYISRVDRAVFVHGNQSLTLMITPERPEEFVERLRGLIAMRG